MTTDGSERMTGTGDGSIAENGACVVKLTGAGKGAPNETIAADAKGCRRTASVATFPVEKEEYVVACRKSGVPDLLAEAREFVRRRWPDFVHLCEDAPGEDPR